MDVLDIPDAITQKLPDDVAILLQKPFHMQDILINRVELRLYKITREDKPYHVIVAYLEMDGHTIQMTYDEGYWEDDLFKDAADFITSQLGMSAMILRARILLDTCMCEDSSGSSKDM